MGVSCVARRIARYSLIHGLRSAGGPLSRLVGVDLGLQLVDAAAEVFQRADHRLDPLRPQTQFFDQPHRTRRRRRESRVQAALRLALGCDLLSGDAGSRGDSA